MKYFSMILLFFTSGCSLFINNNARIENYKEVLNAWLGHSQAELVQVWGTPVHAYEKEGVNYIVYIESDVVQVSNGNKIDRMPRVAGEYMIKSDPGLVNKSCTTLFTVENEKITAWRFEGNDCVAGF